MKTKRFLSMSAQFTLLFIVVMSLTSSFSGFEVTASPNSSYYYKFTVNQEGVTTVEINFESTDSSGSSWVFVPKYSLWSNVTTSGIVTSYGVVPTEKKVGYDYYFYQVLEFSFISTGSFVMKINFSMNEGALIIEPRGMFFSPLIGFDPNSDGKAEVLFPSNFSVERVGSSGKSTYIIIQKHRVVFDLIDKLVRLQIEFRTGGTPKLTQIAQGIFNFQAVERYQNYAYEILSLYENTYDYFKELFNVTLENVKVQFFIPDFDTFLSVGGYVPFIKQKMGEININIFFTRAINGTIQVIALHELVHHFLWKAGLSPEDFLWFHEGMAQYASIEKIDDLGYEGATYERERLEEGFSQLRFPSPPFEPGFGYYLKRWTPSYEPKDVRILYVGSYYVVSELAKMHGGFSYYQRFFKLIRNVTWINEDKNSLLALYLSKAANASVDLTLKNWGFDIALLYTSDIPNMRELIDEAETTIGGLNPVFQPYRFLAEYFYKQALRSFERGDAERAKSLLQLAISMAKLAPFLTLLTIVAILWILVYILYRRSTKPELTLAVPSLPPEIFKER